MKIKNLNHLSSFALIEKDGEVSLYEGQIHQLKKLDEISSLQAQTKKTIVFLNPYNSIRERGYEAIGDEPILSLEVNKKTIFSIAEIIKQLPEENIEVKKNIEPSIPDSKFIKLVKKIQKNEIQGGNATQVILSRFFHGKIENMSLKLVLSIYRKLLQTRGQYMTFLFFYDGQSFIGATPERHLEIKAGEAVMNPIAGTMRKLDKETFERRLEEFIDDPKEQNELFQVVDEEMKMMAKICPHGGVIRGPFLREIGAVIHTEYSLVGKNSSNPIQNLKQTLHAPTLVGGPMQSAARIITKYEKVSRRYYGGEFGILTSPFVKEGLPSTLRKLELEERELDSAILIRCAEIDQLGNFRIQTGAGIVRDSVPEKEVIETQAKAQGLIKILQGDNTSEQLLNEELLNKTSSLLQKRNKHLSDFLFEDQSCLHVCPELKGTKIIIINNEDNFTHILAHMTSHMGCKTRIIDTFDFDSQNNNSDIIILGPGPGDINDSRNLRMKKLRNIVKNLRENKKPILGICLGHQALAKHEGLKVIQQKNCTQGMQRQEIVFGKMERLGFYNSFSPIPLRKRHLTSSMVEVDLDKENHVIAMRGENFIGCQFHPESVMTENGYNILVYCLSMLNINAFNRGKLQF